LLKNWSHAIFLTVTLEKCWREKANRACWIILNPTKLISMKYQVWQSEDGTQTTSVKSDDVHGSIEKGLMGQHPKKLCEFDVVTHEKAMSKYREFMGYDPCNSTAGSEKNQHSHFLNS
jgi:hypothetical protein